VPEIRSYEEDLGYGGSKQLTSAVVQGEAATLGFLPKLTVNLLDAWIPEGSSPKI
jgi:hypothetical protein